jgi:hypothetical protein
MGKVHRRYQAEQRGHQGQNKTDETLSPYRVDLHQAIEKGAGKREHTMILSVIPLFFG